MKKIITIFFYMCLLWLSYFSTSLHAENIPKNDRLKIACEKLNFKDSTYMNSVEKLMALSSTKEWLISLKVNTLALNSTLDKAKYQKFFFWNISSYESNAQKLTLWKIFEIEINGQRIYELDSVNPNVKILISHKNNKVSK